MREIFGCKLGAKCTQFAPNLTDFSPPNHPVSLLESMAGTTGLEPATSAVTGQRSNQTELRPQLECIPSNVPRKTSRIAEQGESKLASAARAGGVQLPECIRFHGRCEAWN